MDMMKEEYKYMFRETYPAFYHWIDGQNGYLDSSWQRWAVSQDRAIKEITESMLNEPDKNQFIYRNNKIYSYGSNDHIIPMGTIEIDRDLFIQIIREIRFGELGI